jgi:hypothetical protein
VGPPRAHRPPPSTGTMNGASVGGGLQETPKGPQRRPLIPTPEVVGRSPRHPSFPVFNQLRHQRNCATGSSNGKVPASSSSLIQG